MLFTFATHEALAELPDPAEPILTREQIAEKLQINPATVYELTRKRLNGRLPIPCLHAGKFLRFYLSEVVKWMRENAR